MKFICYITKGLKDICIQEISDKTSNSDILLEEEKYIIFESKTKLSELTQLATIDDLHLLINFEKVKNSKFNEVLNNLDHNRLNNYLTRIEKFRNTGNRYSLTKSKYNSKADLDEFERILSENIQRITGRNYVKNEESDLDFRLHIDNNKLILSVRISRKPLYYRDYREEGRKGSLRPSIAAAMHKLAGTKEGDNFVDNFCGSGTIICEGVRAGGRPSGGDIDREAVKVARKNLRNISDNINQIKKLDARDTDQPDSYYDVAISNLPWGKQIDINEVDTYSKSISEFKRILKDEGRLVILGNNKKLAEKHVRKNFPNHQIKSFRLGFLGQQPVITVAKPQE